jgi:hypothetical protein
MQCLYSEVFLTLQPKSLTGRDVLNNNTKDLSRDTACCALCVLIVRCVHVHVNNNITLSTSVLYDCIHHNSQLD